MKIHYIAPANLTKITDPVTIDEYFVQGHPMAVLANKVPDDIDNLAQDLLKSSGVNMDEHENGGEFDDWVVNHSTGDIGVTYIVYSNDDAEHMHIELEGFVANQDDKLVFFAKSVEFEIPTTTVK